MTQYIELPSTEEYEEAQQAAIELAKIEKLKSVVLEALQTFAHKRSEYGDTDKVVVEALKAIYPNGIPPERFFEATFTMKILEKLSRLSSTELTNDRLRDAYKDVVGYGLLGVSKTFSSE